MTPVKSRGWPLATITAVVIAVMLLLSVALAYFGVNWYSEHLEIAINQGLPRDAIAAYDALNEGRLPDEAGLRTLVDYIQEISGPEDAKIRLAALVCGLISAVVCALIGIWLARRIAHPLENLTAAADTLRSGILVQETGDVRRRRREPISRRMTPRRFRRSS